MTIHQIIGTLLMLLGLFFIGIGIIGVYRFKDFYKRIAITALIDTAGCLAMVIGLIFYVGFSFFSAKLLIIILFVILLNPLASHMIARGAHESGYTSKREE